MDGAAVIAERLGRVRVRVGVGVVACTSSLGACFGKTCSAYQCIATTGQDRDIYLSLSTGQASVVALESLQTPTRTME